MVVRKVENDRANSTLVIPEWKSAPFWPLLFASNNFTNFIKGTKFLPKEHSVVKGSGKNGVFGERILRFHMLAIKLEF